jgi:hypothetical protein
MSVQPYRIRRKNAKGVYDTLHIESSTGYIIRLGKGTDGSDVTLEDTLTTIESNIEGKVTKITSVKDHIATFSGTDGELADSGKTVDSFAAASHNHAGSAINSGTVGLAYGGTGASLTAAPSLQVDLASTSAAGIFTATPKPGVSGTLAVGNGGTGLTSAPNLKVNLASESTASIFAASPTPGVSGTLPVTHGGTGATAFTKNTYLHANSSGVLEFKSAAQVLSDIGAAAAPADSSTSYVTDDKLGAASGIATLGTDGKVPASQLPSYVDDVIEGYIDGTTKFYSDSGKTTEITPETGKIYVDLSTNKTYRWSGSTFVATFTGSVVTKSSTNGSVKVDNSDIVVYTHPTPLSAAVASGLYKFSADTNGHITGTETVSGDTIKALSGGDMGGASSTAAGTHGFVPAPAKGDQAKFLRGDGTWVAQTTYTHPTPLSAAVTSGLYKFAANTNGHITSTAAVAASDITGLGFSEISFASSEPTGQQEGGLWFEAIS